MNNDIVNTIKNNAPSILKGVGTVAGTVIENRSLVLRIIHRIIRFFMLCIPEEKDKTKIYL